MNRFIVTDISSFTGLKLIERKKLGDSRGYLTRLFCTEEVYAAGWVKPIAQINHTYTSKKGTVRGLHFQKPPHSEMKIVTCIKGEIYDVAVDLRRGFKTFLNFHGEILSADNCRAMLIPEGFAHGFQTLTDDVELIYFHSEVYTPNAEAGVNPLDQSLSIDWRLPITLISDRDNNFPMVNNNFKGVLI